MTMPIRVVSEYDWPIAGLVQRLRLASVVRRWAGRAERAVAAADRGWMPAWSSRHFGPYVHQMFRGGQTPLGDLEVPTDDEILVDRWL